MDTQPLGSGLDISKLSDTDKRDLQQQVSNEMQKAKIQDSIHSLTNTCFTKCIPAGAPSSGKLSGKEESCAQNCVERFLDANTAVLRHLERMRGEGGV